MKQLVEFLATSLVDDPAAVHVEETRSDRKALYSLSVKQEDLGKVIGKKGRTVKAMRVLISALASMQGRQVGLQVIEPEVAPESLESSSLEVAEEANSPGAETSKDEAIQ